MEILDDDSKTQTLRSKNDCQQKPIHKSEKKSSPNKNQEVMNNFYQCSLCNQWFTGNDFVNHNPKTCIARMDKNNLKPTSIPHMELTGHVPLDSSSNVLKPEARENSRMFAEEPNNQDMKMEPLDYLPLTNGIDNEVWIEMDVDTGVKYGDEVNESFFVKEEPDVLYFPDDVMEFKNENQISFGIVPKTEVHPATSNDMQFKNELSVSENTLSGQLFNLKSENDEGLCNILDEGNRDMISQSVEILSVYNYDDSKPPGVQFANPIFASIMESGSFAEPNLSNLKVETKSEMENDASNLPKSNTLIQENDQSQNEINPKSENEMVQNGMNGIKKTMSDFYKCSTCNAWFTGKAFVDHDSRACKAITGVAKSEPIICNTMVQNKRKRTKEKKQKQNLRKCPTCLKYHYANLAGISNSLSKYAVYKNMNKTSRRQWNTKDKKLNFKCSSCKEQFLNIEHLKRHKQRKHSEKYVKCELCPSLFSSVSIMQKHLTVHNGTNR